MAIRNRRARPASIAGHSKRLHSYVCERSAIDANDVLFFFLGLMSHHVRTGRKLIVSLHRLLFMNTGILIPFTLGLFRLRNRPSHRHRSMGRPTLAQRPRVLTQMSLPIMRMQILRLWRVVRNQRYLRRRCHLLSGLVQLVSPNRWNLKMYPRILAHPLPAK